MKDFATRLTCGIVSCGCGSALVLDGAVRWYKTVQDLNDEEKKEEELKNYGRLALSMLQLGIGICDVTVGTKVLTKCYN